MRSAALYSCRSKARPPSREAIILDQLDAALTALADIERRDLPRLNSNSSAKPRPPSGLTIVRPREPIIALGCAAHIALADFEKRTLIAHDLCLEGSRERAVVRDVEQFVWSCVNTLRIVALGSGAWHSAQLLPIGDRRCHKVPPLRLIGQASAPHSVLVIDHEEEGVQARKLVDVLERAKIAVEYTGPYPSSSFWDGCWSSGACIHVHVGDHTLDAEEPRLVDSWRSERLALQLTAGHRVRRAPDSDVLTIENEVNGIICEALEEVEIACCELCDDRVLRQKLIAAGLSTVAPLVKGWGAIADDLLA